MDLLNVLLKDKEQQNELELFLLEHYSGASHVRDREVVFGGRITVKYSKGNMITSIEGSSDVNVEELNEAVQAALARDEDTVSVFYAHSLNRVNGYFKYGDEFQIVPVRPLDPKPDQEYADHPFRLEFKVKKSTSWQINLHRVARKRRELVLLLNAILIYGLKAVPRSASHEWVLVRRGEEVKSEFSQMDYFPDINSLNAGGSFTDTSVFVPISQINAVDYYNITGISFENGNEIVLPDNIKASIDRFYLLGIDEREKFLRASFWRQSGLQSARYSLSAAFSSLVTSIEVFLPQPDTRCAACGRPTSEDSCASCHQPNSGPTKHFRDFVEKYSAGISSKDRSELYSTRSLIVHGGGLLPTDEAITSFTNSRLQSESKWRLLFAIVQAIQINWLHQLTAP